ncbi:MAG: NAD-dependent malic enzyme [Acetobacteraceae bacterium]|nr:NAD-dependent malic enzyme [Acetobacteraceae bacterium]
MAERDQVSAVAPDRSSYELLADPILNKGTAFSEAERDEFHLHGLLPPHVGTLDEQIERRLAVFEREPDDLARYALLRELQDNNETLFYALLTRNIERMLPIVYTPTVGAGCQQFSRFYRKPRGLFLSPPHRDRLDEILGHSHFDGTQVIVVSDGERILGLGDQGAGGMGIPIGKLSLYTACGGIHPSAALPILLDTGTDNEALRHDPVYIGWRHERVRGQEYDDFIEAFVEAVSRRWSHVLLQWEDFAGRNAGRLLDRYRDKLCTFNDDIQGTAAVVTGTIMAALNVSGQKLEDQRIAVVGAGSAGVGISGLLVRAMVEAGFGEAEARRRFYLVDRDGLLVEGGKAEEYQRPFVQPRDAVSGWALGDPAHIGLLDVVRGAKPAILIGVSGQGGAFTEDAIREMARHAKRPVVLPLSNPTQDSEATPSDIMAWTDGRAVIGTGSPFPPVKVRGREIHIDQTNNSYVFPGMGLGILASRARRVSDTMFLAAARALADASPSRQDPDSTLLPPVTAMRHLSRHIARAVGRQAMREGLAEQADDEALERAIAAAVWEPVYRPYRTRS